MKSPHWQSLLLAGLLSFSGFHAFAQSQPSVALEQVSESEIISEVKVNGTVSALRRSRLSSAVAGLIERVMVDAGDRVARGDLLIALDDEIAQFDRDQAGAALDEAEVRLAEARSVGVGRNIAATEVNSRESDLGARKAAPRSG